MSEDFGFQHDDIRTISNILQNYYDPGFPIIKELIQNANYAKSHIVRISEHNGFPDAKHPLLRNHPLLLIYNDGDFTEKDNKNIVRINTDNKTNDETVVRKYGLGMKSIFHLCDMFFYVSKVTSANKQIPIVARPLNPWFNDPYNRHNEWKEFNDDDLSLLKKYYKTEYEEKGFLLIIPLKIKQNEEHIINNCIYQNQNGKGEYFGPKSEFIEKVQQLLIILNTTFENKFLTSIHINLPGYIEQDISINGIPNTKCTNQDSSPIAKKIVDQSIWPKEKKPSDKTTCVLLRLPKIEEKAKLTISHAVYLPLEQDEIIPINTKYSYALMLHGEFATDSGRKMIKGYENIAEETDFNNYLPAETLDQAKIHWNRFLAQQRLYPLIPEVLYKGILEEVIDTEDINELFSVINSEFAAKYHEFITAKNNLARIFINSNIEWQLFYAQKQVYILPESDSEKNIQNFFTGIFLNKIEEDGILVCVPPEENMSIYFLKNTNAETIRLKIIPSIIKGFKNEIFTTSGAQGYLKKYISFIEKESYLDTNILYLFAKRFTDCEHPKLFHSLFGTQEKQERLQELYFISNVPIIPVEQISNGSRKIIYCSKGKIEQWCKEKRIFNKDKLKFAELYSLLSNQDIYIYQNQYTRFNIKSIDADFILNNIGILVETVESINFDDYCDQFDLLLNKISDANNKEQFYRLPIHKIVGSEGYHRIPYGESYRRTGQNNEALFPEGFISGKKIIDTHTFPLIAEKEQALIPGLSKTERIRIFFEKRETINNDEELKWLIDNFDPNKCDELSKILRGKKWIQNSNAIYSKQTKKISLEEIFYTIIGNI